MKLHHLLLALSLSACALPTVAQKPLVRQKPAPAKTTAASLQKYLQNPGYQELRIVGDLK